MPNSVPSTLSVAEQRALHSVRARKHAELGVRDSATAIVVRVKRDAHAVALCKVLVHIFDLAGVDVRHTHLHGAWQIDYQLAVGRGIEHAYHGVAYFEREFGFRPRERFGGVLEAVIAAVFFREFFYECRAVRGYFYYLFLALAEHLFALCDGSGVVQMHYCPAAAAQRLESAAYDMLAALRQHLYGDVVGNEIILYKAAQEVEFRFGRGGEAHLYFLKADAYEQFEKFQFFL